jgi:hypothetical protein
MIVFNIPYYRNVVSAFSNNIYEWKSDNTTSEAVEGIVQIDSYTFKVYKMPNGYFSFNFKEISKILVNKNNYIDKLETNIISDDTDTFTYAQNECFHIPQITFSVKLKNGETESIVNPYNFKIIASALTLENYKINSNFSISPNLLLPFKINEFNGKNHYLTFNIGYPLDFTFYSNFENLELEANVGAKAIKILTRKSNLTRVFFSDGVTSVVNSLWLYPTGLVEIKFKPLSAKNYLFLKIEPYCQKPSVYMKWLNAFGGYSYFLFYNFKRDVVYSNIGDLENDFYNFENTISPVTQIGRTAIDKISVDSDNLSDENFNHLIEILGSPKVFFYKGVPNTVSKSSDWIEIEIKTNNQNVKNYKDRPKKIAFEFELPKRNNQHL